MKNNEVHEMYSNERMGVAVVQCTMVNPCVICNCPHTFIAINGQLATIKCNLCGKTFSDQATGETKPYISWFVNQMIDHWNSENTPINDVDTVGFIIKAEDLEMEAADLRRKAAYFDNGSEWTLEFDPIKLRPRTYIRCYNNYTGRPKVEYGWIKSSFRDGHYDVVMDDRYDGERMTTVDGRNIIAVARLPKDKKRPDYKI